MVPLQAKSNLDALRAFAVTLVVLNHLFVTRHINQIGSVSIAFIGLVGVYMFFVHTSLVLMWSLDRKPHTLDFYIRRAFRIYPLVWVALLFTLSLRLPMAPLSKPIGAGQVIANFLLLQNLHSSGNLIGVLWSLPIEVDMYLLLPPLFFFVRKNYSLWPLLIFWAFASLLATPLTAAYGNILFTDIPCFLPGVMAYVLFSRVRARLPAWLFPIFLFVLTGFCLGFPVIQTSWIICLALGLALPFFHQIQSSAVRQVCHELAKYSYGIYLGHPFSLYLAFHILEKSPFSLQMTVFVGSMVLFAWGAYHTVEKPMIRLGTRAAAFVEKRYEQQELEAVL